MTERVTPDELLAAIEETLHPTDRKKLERDLKFLSHYYRRSEGRQQVKKASKPSKGKRKGPHARSREQLAKLEKHLRQSATMLSQLEPLAFRSLVDAGYDASITVDEHGLETDLADYLGEIAEQCSEAHSKVLKKEGGVNPNTVKRDFVRRAARIYEKHTTKKAGPTTDPFQQFLELAWEWATGEEPSDEELKRAKDFVLGKSKSKK